MPRFNKIPHAAPIEVFAVSKGYAEDTDENKVNLGVGAYRTDDGQPWVLPVVRKVEQLIANDHSLNHEYLTPLGLESFTKAATELILGKDSPALLEQRAIGIQALSGTGSLRIGAEFLATILNYTVCYVSNPTWGNHKSVFINAGFKECRQYRYWSEKEHNLDIKGFLEDLRDAPANAVIILHTCAHNPTGCDPTQEQWKEISEIIREKRLFPFFDSAYQGFASGDLDRDAWPVRYFIEKDFELFAAQSFAKNFGLYNERVGNLVVVTKQCETITAIKSQFSTIVRAMYSNPPNHGARIVATILNNPDFYDQWKECIIIMSSRIRAMRLALYKELMNLEIPGKWEHITNQIGMFSYTGLSEIQSMVMTQKYHVYMLKSGRISMAGLNPSNVAYVAKAIYEVVTTQS